MIRNAREEYPDFFARHGLAGVPRSSEVPAGVPAGDRRSSKSFGLQWTLYQEGDATWFKEDAGLRKREFLYNLDTTPEELRGTTLLDGGCGNGELTRSVAEYGPEIVAMDFSRSVEHARRRLFEKGFPVSHRVHYLQGNILEFPLLPTSFDLVHTSGVLHHTPSTYRAFRSISTAVKPGGKLYVQLYRLRPRWIHAVNVALRAVTTRLPMGILYGLCYAATPVHAGLSRLMHRPPPPARPAEGDRPRARRPDVRQLQPALPVPPHGAGDHGAVQERGLHRSEGRDARQRGAPHARRAGTEEPGSRAAGRDRGGGHGGGAGTAGSADGAAASVAEHHNRRPAQDPGYAPNEKPPEGGSQVTIARAF